MEAKDRLAMVKLSAEAFAESDVLNVSAQDELVRALYGATFDEYEAVRVAWQSAYAVAMGERNADGKKPTDEAIRKAWSRLTRAAAIEKPKSEKPSAKAMNAKREADEAAQKYLAGFSDSAIAESIEGLRDFAADGNRNAVERIVTLKREQARRAKETADAESDATKQLRKAVADLVKTAPHETLEIVRAILAGELEVNMPEETTEQLREAA